MTTIQLSQTRIAREGRAYLERFVGRAVEHTTYEGEKLVGILEFPSDGPAQSSAPVGLVIRFPDGGWAFAEYRLKVVG
jgi:hypothetical protein